MCDVMRAPEEYVYVLVRLRKVRHLLRDSRASERKRENYFPSFLHVSLSSWVAICTRARVFPSL